MKYGDRLKINKEILLGYRRERIQGKKIKIMTEIKSS